jgi:hypothetical protein
MACYVAWLGPLGIIKASSMQPYLSAVNNFFKDHGLEAIAIGGLVAKVRKGLVASQVAIEDIPIHVHMLASIVIQALRMAQALRFQITDSTTRAELQASPTRDQIRLLRGYGHMYYCCKVVLIL